MKMKTFHAASVQEAIRQARQQLGPDAMLLTSKRLTGADGEPDQFAVSFAYQSPAVSSPRGNPDSGNQDSGKHDPAKRDTQVAGADVSAAHTAVAPLASSGNAPPGAVARTQSLRDLLAEGGTARRAARGEAPYDRTDTQPYQLAQRVHQAATPHPGAATRSANPETAPRRAEPEVDLSVLSTKPMPRMGAAIEDDLPSGLFTAEPSPKEDKQAWNCPAPANSVGDSVPQSGAREHFDRLGEQMLSLRREMLQLAGSVRRVNSAGYRQGLPSEALRLVYDHLVEQEFQSDLIERILGAMRASLGESEGSQAPQAVSGRTGKRRVTANARADAGSAASIGGPLLAALQDAVASCVDLAPEPGFRRKRTSPLVISLVGPPGAGKTTTLVKLAVRLSEASRFPLQVISMDNFRVGASEQLRAYAAVLGVGFDALTTVRALDKAVSQYASKEVILVDTPGLGWRDFDAAGELAAYLRSLENAITYLVAPASMRAADLERIADLYEEFNYQNLIFTKLDETALIGPLVSESWRRRKPLSYFANGQRIPEDLELASRERICERVLPADALALHFAA